MIENQVYIFLWTLLVGAVMGLIFDLFRIIRRKGTTKDIFVYIQDIIFWLLVATIIIVSSFLINDGELRGYMILGYILGALFYMLIFSNTIRKIGGFILDSIEKGAKILAKKLISFTNIFKKKKNVKI